MTMRARNWLGSFPALLHDRRALLEIAVDAVLVGAGLAMAAGAIGFAGLMVVEGNHKPDVFGLKYLAIYAQPRRTAKPAGETGPSPKPPARGGIDMSPVGSIGSAPPATVGGFVSAQPGLAWLREGSRIVAVRPGDVRAGLGRISSRPARRTLVLDRRSGHGAAVERTARGQGRFGARAVQPTDDFRRQVMVAATLAARRRRGKSAPIRRWGFSAARRKFRGPEPDAGISSMPVPDSRLLSGSLPRINSRHPDVRNSLVAGKNAGNFVELAYFCENLSRKHLRIQ